MSPAEAIQPENFLQLFANYYSKNTDIFKDNKEKRNLKVGDIVRISALKGPFGKEGVEGNWTIELFKITKVNETNPVTYGLEDLMGEEVKGAYYEAELQKVPKELADQPAEVEKVIKTRKKNGQTESFVKFRGYPDKFNAWIVKA